MGGLGWQEIIIVLVAALFNLALLVGVVALGVFAWRRLAGRSSDSQRSSRPALDILEERYARGEIDAAELTERRRVLNEGRASWE